jgi:tetratricopeptide (TPR) repeat protein
MNTKLNLEGEKLPGKVIGILFLSLCLLTNINLASGISNSEAKTSSSRIFRAMARVYIAEGEYTKAQGLAENALILAKSDKGPESDSERCKCLIDLAFLYKNQGRFSDAQKACEAGLELQKKIYYKDHPYIAATLRILSSIYQGQCKYSQAEKTLAQAIHIMQKSHLPDDPALAPYQVDMARLLAAQGKFNEAEALYLPALEVINKSYGPDHLYTAGVISSLAELYTLQKKDKKAEELTNIALKIQNKSQSTVLSKAKL